MMYDVDGRRYADEGESLDRVEALKRIGDLSVELRQMPPNCPQAAETRARIDGIKHQLKDGFPS
jgi:hypothetical protein